MTSIETPDELNADIPLPPECESGYFWKNFQHPLVSRRHFTIEGRSGTFWATTHGGAIQIRHSGAIIGPVYEKGDTVHQRMGRQDIRRLIAVHLGVDYDQVQPSGETTMTTPRPASSGASIA